MPNIPFFATHILMQQFTSKHVETQDFFNTAQSALRYYSVAKMCSTLVFERRFHSKIVELLDDSAEKKNVGDELDK